VAERGEREQWRILERGLERGEEREEEEKGKR
jgi:hypothetical protein